MSGATADSSHRARAAVVARAVMETLEGRQLLAQSAWAFPGADGKLLYRPLPAGDKIGDYSGVGYRGGTVPIPNVPTKITISPIAGDNRAHIQAAIDAVEAMTPDASGFRGAVLLNPGVYEISTSVTINTSGVVLRGSGQGQTILLGTGLEKDTVVRLDGSGTRSMTGPLVPISDKYVPLGALSFSVDASQIANFAVGDQVIIERKATTQWLHDVGMDLLDNPWTSRDVDMDRVITRIDGNVITLDAPLSHALDKIRPYGGGTIQKYTATGRLANVGVEYLSGQSTFNSAELDGSDRIDEDHAEHFIGVDGVINGWVRNVTSEYFGYSCVNMTGPSKWVTVQDSQCLDPVSVVTGGRRYSFNMGDSTSVLWKNLYTRHGRHDYVQGSEVTGPNVVVDSRADNARADTGPHHRYSTGTLWDNLDVNGNGLNIQNRHNSGSGHGWAGANQVVWNSDANSFIIQNIGDPVSAWNWSIGNTGTHSLGNTGPQGEDGIWDSHNAKVDTRSLYHAQLGERMAHENFALREVRLGDADGFVNDGAVDNVFVDATWRTNIQAATGQTGVGFDNVAANHLVPFTFNFNLDPGTYVVGAQLTLGLKSGSGGPTAGDRIYIENASRVYTWADFAVPNPDGTAQGAILDISKLIAAMQDGKLNIAISGNAAVDWATLNFQTASTTQPTRTTLNPAADAYVRGGASAGSNFGTASTLVTKLEGVADNVHESYLKFSLASLLNQPVVGAYVRLVPTSVGVHSTTFGSSTGVIFNQIGFVANDTWTETGINFTNKPGSDPFFREFVSYANEPVMIDVTSLVRGALAGDKTLSLRLNSVVSSATGQISFASREHGTVQFRPQLVIDTYNGSAPVADATVRSGTFANTNFGTAPDLAVKQDTSPTSDNNREAYLKFAIPALPGAPAGATLRLVPLITGANVLQGAALATNDTWTETGITWNTKPGFSTLLGTWRPDAVMPTKFDVTSLLGGSVGADGLLSLRVFGNSTSAGVNTYASREYGDASLVPLLVFKNLGPQITGIPRVNGNVNTASGPLWFGVWDAETTAGSLTVSATSSNTTLLPSANITFGGSGADRTFTLTPAAGQGGTSNVTITVTDAQGLTAQTTFVYFVDNAVPLNGDQSAPNQDDVFRIVRNGTFVDVFRNDMVNPILHQDYATSPRLKINGLGGNDQVLFDLSGGNPIPADGLVIDGGSATDIVSVIGGSGNDAVTLSAGNVIVGGLTTETLGSEELRLSLGAGADTITSAGNGSVSTSAVLLNVSGGGSVDMAAGSTLPNFTDVTINAAVFDLNGTSQTIDGLSGNGTVRNDGAAAATLTVGNAGGGGTFTGVLQNGTQTLGLTKVGAGTLTLSGANAYSGVTTISGGTIASGNAASLAGTNSFVMFSGGTFRVTGNTQSINLANKYSTNHSFAGTTATFEVDAGVTFTVGTPGGSASMRTAGGSFSGGGFFKTGAGTLRIVSNNGQLDDPFTLNAGTVILESATGLGGADNSANHLDMKAGTTLVLKQDAATNFLTPIVGLDAGGAVNVVIDRLTAGAGVTHALNGISGAGAYTLNVSAGANVTSGTAGLTLGSAVVAAAGTFNIVGTNVAATIPGVVSGAAGVTKNGSGLLTLTGANTYAGPTLINAGILDVAAGAIPAGNAVTVNSSGTYRMTGGAGAAFDLGNLTVNSGGAARINTPAGAQALLSLDTLTIGATGLLHTADADLLWDYGAPSPLLAAQNLVATGRSTGNRGIVTDGGAGDQVLAVLDNAAYGQSTFRGVTIDPSTLIGRFTYFGDANLDGAVTGDDYLAIDSNLGIGNGTRQWFHGDFNMDGSVTGDDYLAVDANLGKGTAAPAMFAEDQAALIELHAQRFGGETYVQAVEAAAAGHYKLYPRKTPAAGGKKR